MGTENCPKIETKDPGLGERSSEMGLPSKVGVENGNYRPSKGALMAQATFSQGGGCMMTTGKLDKSGKGAFQGILVFGESGAKTRLAKKIPEECNLRVI